MKAENDPFDFFSVTPKEILRKLDEFSDLEISEEHQGVALMTLLLEEGIEIPSWCQFLLHRGFIDTRRKLLTTYRGKSVPVQ